MNPGSRALLSVAALVIIGAGIKLAAPVLVPLLVASFIAIVTSPLVSWCVRKGIPRALAITLAMLVDVAVLGIFVALIGSSGNAFYTRLPYYQASLVQAAHQLSQWLASHNLPLPPDWTSRLADPAPVIGTIAALLRGVASLVSNLVLVLLIVGFMLVETTRLQEKLRGVLEPAAFERVRRASAQIDRYLVFKTAISLVTGTLLGLWCYALGVDFPVLWGLLAFVLNYIPTVGSILASIPPVLVALVTHDPGRAVLIASGYLTVNFIIGNVLDPRILGRALGLSPLVILLSIVLWGWLLGPMGALLSVPLTMVIKIYLDHDPALQRYAAFLGNPVAGTESPSPRAVDGDPADAEVAAPAHADLTDRPS